MEAARWEVFRNCVHQVRKADALYARLSNAAYGTMFEIGVAYQAGVPIFLETANITQDQWLLGKAAISSVEDLDDVRGFRLIKAIPFWNSKPISLDDYVATVKSKIFDGAIGDAAHWGGGYGG
jgi:nucleoside 2-deoxyribosyltransferase